MTALTRKAEAAREAALRLSHLNHVRDDAIREAVKTRTLRDVAAEVGMSHQRVAKIVNSKGTP